MKKIFTLILCLTITGFTHAQSTKLWISSNSILNEFKCGDQEWVGLDGSYHITFDGPCTPLQGKNRDSTITLLDTTAICENGLLAVYAFHGWEHKWEFLGCHIPGTF